MKIIYSVFNIGLLLASDKSFFNLIANNVNINPKTKPYTRPLAKVKKQSYVSIDFIKFDQF
ncbi:MAG: hypothetical protein RSB02_06875 [Anaerovoracaceae bacterium]|jgi:hypothetical protein